MTVSCCAHRADRNYRVAARKAYMAGVSEGRREWLKKLEAQAASWIPADKIDEVRGGYRCYRC